jgi:hypothetical protein
MSIGELPSLDLEYFPDQYLGYPSGVEADRQRQTRKFERMIEHTGFDKHLESPESRTRFIDELSDEEFVILLREMDGVFVNLPRSYRRLAEHTQVSVEDGGRILDIYPYPEDKIPLLSEVLATSKDMKTLEDKAFMLAVGINAVHPFMEGNGRISRSTYYLLTNGYKPDDKKLHDILGTEGESIITPDANIVRPVIMANFKLRLGTHNLDKQGYPKAKLDICNTNPNFRLSDMSRKDQPITLRDVAVSSIFMHEDYSTIIPWLAVNILKSKAAIESVIEHNDKKFFAVNKFWEHATEQDIDAFYEVFRMVKNSYVQELLTQLTKGEESWPVGIPNTKGQMEALPMAILMRAIVRGDKGMSGVEVRDRLARF